MKMKSLREIVVIFLFLFGIVGNFVILRQYKDRFERAIACFQQQRALMNFFSDEVKKNFENSDILPTFVLTKTNRYASLHFTFYSTQ